MNSASTLFGILLAVTMVSSGAVDGGGNRFQHHGHAREVSQSDDGRYTLSASVRFTPASQKCSNGHYAVRALGANCGSSSDLLLRDGFEGAP